MSSASQRWEFIPPDVFNRKVWVETCDKFRNDGVVTIRATVIDAENPDPIYPEGVWVEGWYDEVEGLPFGTEVAGLLHPPLYAGEH